eukprot:1459590-Ditylum_brightwellii.AAC.1
MVRCLPSASKVDEDWLAQHLQYQVCSSADFYKTELQEKLMGDNVECGAYFIAISEINGLKLTELAYRG